MIDLSNSEIEFVMANECCRLATSHDDKPHVVPVSYVYENGLFYVATDYNTRKLKNIRLNPNVCLVIDIYQPGNHKGLVVFGVVRVVEHGELFRRIYSIFYEKFEWVRKNPWSENESPFLEIVPTSKIEWGIN